MSIANASGVGLVGGPGPSWAGGIASCGYGGGGLHGFAASGDFSSDWLCFLAAIRCLLKIAVHSMEGTERPAV